MKFFNTFDVAASGMSAQRKQMDVISSNIANVNTSQTADGTPFRRMVAVISQKQLGDWDGEFRAVSFDGGTSNQAQGVEVSEVVQDASDFKWVYDPSNPQAEQSGPHKGYVAMPNINLISEMTNLIQASRSFEANATVVESAKSMAMKALEIGKG